jgi:pimeloyl-ACP methyl ester carboxylesterase
MQRCVLAGILILAALVPAASATAATVRSGPAGTKFYVPPKPLPAGKHGALVWERKLTGKAVLKSAASNRLVLYRSNSVDGKATAVSGTVAIPKGKAPKRGWPVITWAHGTTGIADRCAITRSDVNKGYDRPLLNAWLRAGYAVVRTDYEGLGTPGEHPFLIGVSEGRSVLDMVRAARRLDPTLGKRVVIAGHSQGGHAALWAASLAKQWTPELTIRGTLAFAPANHLGEQGALLRALTAPSRLSGLASMIVRGIDVSEPSLNIGGLLSDRAKALYPQVDSKCLDGLAKPDSFGGLAPAELFRPDAALDPVIAALNANDPETLTPRGPVLIEQGKADTTVFPNFTDQLKTDYDKRGINLTYKTYEGVNHEGVVTNKTSAADATKWVGTRF